MITLLSALALTALPACKSGPDEAADAPAIEETETTSDDDAMGDEATGDDTTAAVPPSSTAMVDVDLVAIVEAPHDYFGASVDGVVYVDEVVSDRGFYITDGNARLFAVIREDEPAYEMIDIDEGQIIAMEGLLLERPMWRELTGELDAQTKAIIKDRPYFVAMHHTDVDILAEDLDRPEGTLDLDTPGG